MWLRRVLTTLTGRHRDRDLDEEIRAHIDLLAAENERRGMSSTEARYAARRAFGAVEPMKERYRDRQTLRWLDDLRRDAGYALRGLKRTPGFTVVAVLTLALAIGANTAIFSLLDAVLLRSLPVDRPQQLVFLRAAGTGNLGNAPPYPAFERIRDQTSSFDGIAAFATDELRVDVDGLPEQVFGQVVSGSYFRVLGLTPAVGRLMTSDDEALDPPVAVIGYGYAQRRFGSPVSAPGRTLSFRGRTFTIVGVTQPRFAGLEPGRRVDVTLPITQERALLVNPQARWFNVVARVRPALAISRADVEVNAIFQSFLADRGRKVERLRSQVDRVALTPASRGLDPLRTRFSSPLVLLAIVAATLLLVACANLAGLLLVRGAARGREFAIRLAIGAGSARLIRQVLTETLVLFVGGAAAGLLVASLSIQGLTSFFAVGRRPVLLDVRYDWWIVAYATAVTLGATYLTGLWPALRAMRTDPQRVVRGGTTRPARSRRGAVTGHMLVTGQVAFSLALIVAAALFVRTIVNLRRVDVGFRPSAVLTMSLRPEFPGNATPAERESVWRRLLERVRGLPGVRAASLSVLTPLSGRNTGAMVTAPGSGPREARLNHISEDYFRAFETQVLAGRTFESTDAGDAAKVAVLNETASRAVFPGRSPIGERIVIGSAGEYQVVGVVRDHKHQSLREAAAPFVFVPMWQPIDALGRLTLAVASDSSHAALTKAVAGIVRAVDSSILMSDVIGVEDQIEATLVTERVVSMVATAAAAIVLGLAVIGLYGIVSYSVARRKREFGIRLALGAPRVLLASGVVRQVLAHAVAGIVAGVPLAIAIARAAEVLLFGVSSTDSMSYVAGAGALVLAAGVAALLPALRAARIDPVVSLRAE